MTRAAPRPPGEATETDAEGTRARLLRAAGEVIQEGGWGSASVGAIAARAGLAAGTLYRHFQSKAELFVEVFRAVSERELGAMFAASARAGSVPQRFEAVVATYAGRALRNRRLAWALVYEPVDPMVDAERLAYRRDYRESMARLLREGIAAGALPAQDADLAAAAVVGVIAETLVGPLSPVADVTASEAETVAAIVALCRRVVGLPDPSPPAPVSRRVRKSNRSPRGQRAGARPGRRYDR
jgi:AcrR family transcriptional regulator